MPEDAALRDFYYLDIEKVRSFVAQIRQGLPETYEKAEKQAGGAGLNLGVKADFAYERTAAETHSLHHYLYTILESALRASEKLLEVDAAFSDWNSKTLVDGQFVLVEGVVSLLDFERVVEGMQGLPNLLAVAGRFQQQSLAKKVKAGEMTQLEYQQAVAQLKTVAVPKKDVDDIAGIIRELYAGVIRVKIYPFRGDWSRYFVGTLFSPNLQRERTSVYSSGQVSPASTWKALGLVDQLATGGDIPAPHGETLEDKVAAMLNVFAQMGQFTMATKWPVVSFTPLAVYREV